MKKQILAATLALAAGAANAVTDCQGSIGWIGTDVTTGYSYGQLTFAGSTGVGFSMLESAPGYKTAMQNVYAARTLNAQIFFRFAASGVSCTTNAVRTDIQQIWLVP